MSHQALVSVVIPSYNHEQFIGEAIESILNQSYQKIEIIIIDDGSTDGTRDILSAYESDSRFKIDYQENQGAAFTINAGLEKACGHYIAILNSDDVYHPDRLEKLVSLHRSQSNEDLILYTTISFIDQDSRSLGQASRAQFYKDWMEFYKKYSPENHFIHGNLLTTTSNLFFTNGTLAKIGNFVDLRYCHDWEWVIRANQVSKIDLVEEPLLYYRIHASNTILEQDLVRHSLENAFVFSSLIQTKKSARHEVEDLLSDVSLFAESKYFYSFLILVVLYLRNNIGQENTLALLKSGGLSSYIENFLHHFEKSKEAIFSIKHVEEVVNSLRDGIERYKDDIQKAHSEIGNLQEKIRALVEKNTTYSRQNREQSHQISKQSHQISKQSHQISKLTENDALQERYIQFIERSFFFQLSLCFENLRRKFVYWRKVLQSFSVLDSNIVSSDLSSNARYIFHIDWPGFDSDHKYLHEGQGEVLPISGWIIDRQKNKPLDNAFIATGDWEQTVCSSQLRPAVAEVFKSKRLAYCGFKFEVPIDFSNKSISFRIGFTQNSQKFFSPDEFEVLINGVEKMNNA